MRQDYKYTCGTCGPVANTTEFREGSVPFDVPIVCGQCGTRVALFNPSGSAPADPDALSPLDPSKLADEIDAAEGRAPGVEHFDLGVAVTDIAEKP